MEKITRKELKEMTVEEFIKKFPSPDESAKFGKLTTIFFEGAIIVDRGTNEYNNVRKSFVANEKGFEEMKKYIRIGVSNERKKVYIIDDTKKLDRTD